MSELSQAGKVLAVATGEIGVKESPAGSNNVKYNTAYYGQAVHDGLWGTKFPWCAVFVWWCFREAGLSELFYAGGKTASCTTLWSWFKGKGQTVPIGQAQSGDVVFFNWTRGPKGTVANHVGIVESRSGDTLTTIEGNTAVGNDGNGGAVMRRTRKANVVLAVARPSYQTAKLPQAPDSAVDKPAEWAKGAWEKAQTTKGRDGKPILDGTRPTDTLTRQELAVVLDRLGVLG